MKNILLWLRIIRPQTLFASVCPVMVALCMSGMPRKGVGIITIISAMSLQILSNLINDYYDYIRGTDKAGRIGYKRALAEGDVRKGQMQIACYIALGVAVITGGWLCYVGGWVIVGIGVSAILFAWLYTATNHSLSYLGIADVFVLLYYGILAGIGTAILQGVSISNLCAYASAGAVSGLISMCVLMINNLRDISSDEIAGKRTFPVRFGKKAGEGMMLMEVLLMPIMAYLTWGWSIPMLVIIPTFLLWIGVCRAKEKTYNKCLLLAGVVNGIYVLLVVGEMMIKGA